MGISVLKFSTMHNVRCLLLMWEDTACKLEICILLRFYLKQNYYDPTAAKKRDIVQGSLGSVVNELTASQGQVCQLSLTHDAAKNTIHQSLKVLRNIYNRYQVVLHNWNVKHAQCCKKKIFQQLLPLST